MAQAQGSSAEVVSFPNRMNLLRLAKSAAGEFITELQTEVNDFKEGKVQNEGQQVEKEQSIAMNQATLTNVSKSGYSGSPAVPASTTQARGLLAPAKSLQDEEDDFDWDADSDDEKARTALPPAAP